MLSDITLEVDDREKENILRYYLDVFGNNLSSWDEHVQELNAGRPVQYVCGLAFFYGYSYYVDESVLIPRAETEELVYWVVSDHKRRESLHVLDVGAGSGCILVSVLNSIKNSKGTAMDISSEALEVAVRNARKYGHDIECLHADVLKSTDLINWSEVDVLVCNPPYISREELSRMDDSVLSYEPDQALFVDDPDVLLFYKHIIAAFIRKGTERCQCYFETSDLYHETLEEWLQSQPVEYSFQKDMQGKWRMLKVWKRD